MTYDPQIRKDVLRDILSFNKSVKGTAERYGIGRKTIYRWLKQEKNLQAEVKRSNDERNGDH